MARLPEMRLGDENGGLRRYTTAEYESLAFEAFIVGGKAAKMSRNRMENLEAMYFRGFEFSSNTAPHKGRYYKDVRVGDFIYRIVVDEHSLELPNLWKYLDYECEKAKKRLRLLSPAEKIALKKSNKGMA